MVGASDGTRTHNSHIKGVVLYQLSYEGLMFVTFLTASCGLAFSFYNNFDFFWYWWDGVELNHRKCPGFSVQRSTN